MLARSDPVTTHPDRGLLSGCSPRLHPITVREGTVGGGKLATASHAVAGAAR